MVHGHIVRRVGALALVGLVFNTGSVNPSRAAGSTLVTVPSDPAGCRLRLMGHGLYQLEVGAAGPLPVVTFKKAKGPSFDPIKWEQGRPGSCDYPLGKVAPLEWSRNSTPLLYHVATTIQGELKNKYYTSMRPQFAFPYKKLNNLTTHVTTGALLRGIQQGVAAAAAELIRRYANPTSFLTDAGAKWVAEQGIKLMLQSYVEGRDPGLIIDGMLADMVKYLESNANKFVKTVGGMPLEQAMKPHLKQMAADLTKALVEDQPESQYVRVTATNDADDCVHYLEISWNMKGGVYNILLTIRCGPQQNDFIKSIAVKDVTVKPGGTTTITAEARSQLGVPMPLAAATITGVARVMPDGSAEPMAVIPGNVADFKFTAAKPRADKVYDNVAKLTTAAFLGSLTGLGRGKVEVENVAPTIVSIEPKEVSAAPGGQLELKNAILTLIDLNADDRNVNEIVAKDLKLEHPASLGTRPKFSEPTGTPDRIHSPATGQYKLRFNRSGKVDLPHRHGSWPLTLAIKDDQGETATTTLQLTVTDVPPVVNAAQASPQFVHRGQGASIDVTVRVSDSNGADDILTVSVDATGAGGGRYTTANGLTEVARGSDWIDFRIDKEFPQTNNVGRHPIPVTVTDETGTVPSETFLNVGNLAPEIGTTGLLFDADSLSDPNDPDSFILVPPKALCPGDHITAGISASDPENDTLVVKGMIVGTGKSFDFVNKSKKVWIADMVAPARPGTYVVRMTVSEKPADKESSHDMTIVVKDCGDREEDEATALAIPTNATDVAAAPRDQSSQLFFGEIFGGILYPVGFASSPVSGAAPGRGGPSVSELGDSIQNLLGAVVGDDRASVETYFISTGGSTGPVAQMFALNQSDAPLQLNSQMVVLEPVAITPAIQARVTGLVQQFIAAGGKAATLNAYCLEFLRQPPAAGTLMRLASADIAAPFADNAKILDAARQLRDAGVLNPDSDSEEYFHAVRQWAIWTHEEGFDAKQFGAAFLERTKKNLAVAGTQWTDEVESSVRDLIPNRWNDLQQVLHRAGLESQ